MNATPERRTLTELLGTCNRVALARRLGVDRATIRRWERGEIIPAGDKLQALARELGVSADSIILDKVA